MLKVNGVAKGQYKQLCQLSWHKCQGNENLLIYKIRRAVDLGETTFNYSNGCRIVRYHNLNFLVSEEEVMTIWRDVTRADVEVKAEVKDIHKELILNQILSKDKLLEIVINNYVY